MPADLLCLPKLTDRMKHNIGTIESHLIASGYPTQALYIHARSLTSVKSLKALFLKYLIGKHADGIAMMRHSV